MSQAQQHVLRPWKETDVEHVLRSLRAAGPLPLAELLDRPELQEWSARRVEDAVVAAWSRNLISIDPRDLLVVL